MTKILIFKRSKKDEKLNFVSSIKTDIGLKIVFGNRFVNSEGVYECKVEEFENHFKVLSAEPYVPIIEVTDENNGVLFLESSCGFRHTISLQHNKEQVAKNVLWTYLNPKTVFSPFRKAFTEQQLLLKIEEFLTWRNKNAKKMIFFTTSYIQFK